MDNEIAQAMETSETMEIIIPLGDMMSKPRITDNDKMFLGTWLPEAMIERDLNVTMPGLKLPGYITRWEIVCNSNYGSPELHITVNLCKF